MGGSQRRRAGQERNVIWYRWRQWEYLLDIRRIPTIRGHTQGNDYARDSSG
jgi:hypothetical protein